MPVEDLSINEVLSGAPIPELHLHLDGSLRPETAEELARELGLAVPPDLCFCPGMGLRDALSRFQFTLSLLQQPHQVERVAGEICEDAEHDGVVGIDLAGGPTPSQRWSMVDYAPAFSRARDVGLGRTVHAGEGRPPAEIGTAIELHAQRIGHGTTLLDDPAILELVLERQVTIEACATSNWHVGAIPTLEEHPICRWLSLGVRACVCADNTLLSAVTTREELSRVSGIPGMNDELMADAVRNGHAAAFTWNS